VRTYALDEAAAVCGVSVKALQRRCERGTLRAVVRDGRRLVPHAELERAGLLPDAEVAALRAQLARAQRELAAQRQLVASVERSASVEREARERMEAGIHEERAQRAATERQRDELTATLEEIAAAGPIRALRLRRVLRAARAAQ
jgi:hypothetical protein